MSLVSKCCGGKVYKPTVEWARCLHCMEMCEVEHDECPYNICDGSGVAVIGELDDSYERKCPCANEVDVTVEDREYQLA